MLLLTFLSRRFFKAIHGVVQKSYWFPSGQHKKSIDAQKSGDATFEEREFLKLEPEPNLKVGEETIDYR